MGLPCNKVHFDKGASYESWNLREKESGLLFCMLHVIIKTLRSFEFDHSTVNDCLIMFLTYLTIVDSIATLSFILHNPI